MRTLPGSGLVWDAACSHISADSVGSNAISKNQQDPDLPLAVGKLKMEHDDWADTKPDN